MSAAATPFAVRSATKGHEAQWDAYFARKGFVRTPHGFRAVLAACSPIQSILAWHVLQETVGARVRAGSERPQWIVLTEVEAAKIAGCTKDGAGLALNALEQLRVLLVEKHGRTKRYSPNLEGWDDPHLPKRAKRVLQQQQDVEEQQQPEQEAEQTEEATASETPRAPFVLRPVRARAGEAPQPVPLGASIRQVVYRGDDAPELTIRVAGQTLEIEAAPVAKKGRTIEVVDYPVSSDKSSAVNKTDSELRVALNAELSEILGPIDEAMLARVAGELNGSPMASLIARVRARKTLFRRPNASWGAVVLLARDVTSSMHDAPAAPPPAEMAIDRTAEYEEYVAEFCAKLPVADEDVAAKVREMRKAMPAVALWSKQEQREAAQRALRSEMAPAAGMLTYREWIRRAPP